MSLKALNRWRLIYLAEASLAILFPLRGRSTIRFTLLLGASLWLLHDLAHSRWRVALADAAAVSSLCLWARASQRVFLMPAILAIGYAALHPERHPSPFVWARRGLAASHDASSAPAAGQTAFPGRPAIQR